MTRTFPLVFVFLWASAFIASKIIVQDATPFAALTFRFVIVAAIFALITLVRSEFKQLTPRSVGEALSTGVLFHGFYLGGVFYSIAAGLPAGISALIVSMQPILTTALAGPLLGEVVTRRQWLGILLGFVGTALVLGLDVGTALPWTGVIAAVVALVAVTAGTLWQKTLSGKLPLSTNNTFQAVGAALFHCGIMFLIEDYALELTPSFIWAMGWLIVGVSFGAFTILMILIRTGSASKTAALFFLVPPVSVVLGWLMLDEVMTLIDVVGLVIASFGVYVATRTTAAS